MGRDEERWGDTGRYEEICARVTGEQLGRAARGRASRRRRRRAVGRLVLRGREEAQPAALHDEDARLAVEVVGGLPAARGSEALLTAPRAARRML